MSSLNTALRQETALGNAPAQQRTLSPPWAARPPAGAHAAAAYNFTLQSVGGVVFLHECVPGAQPERGIHWQVENSATGALHLTEFTVHGGVPGPRVTLETASQLFPALAATGTPDGRVLLAALLSNGQLLHAELSLPRPSPTAPDSTSSGALAGLTAASLRPLDLSQQLAPLGTPTSLAATPDAVLVGGSNGSVLVVPLAALADGNAARCHELRDSSWALSKLIPGVLYRPRQPAALACLPVTLAHRQLLLVSYDDCMLRVFNVARRQQLATLELAPPPAAAAAAGGHNTAGHGGSSGGSARHLVPTYIAAESPQPPSAAGAAGADGGGGAAAVVLVVQFEASDTLRRHTVVYGLAASAAGRLSLSGGTELAVEEGGVVAEARVSGETVWLLVRAQGRTKVLGFSRSSGAVVSSAVLAEAAGEAVSAGTAAVGGNGAEVDQELWEWLLRAFPDHLSAEGQVCQQVLVPGQTCRSSLRDALSYHGAQLASAEVESAPHGVLRGWMQAAVMAIQRRAPTASPAECWQSFLATYRAAWARRHPPLSLVLHRASPDWLGLARGGGVLGVLRRGTGVEALTGAGSLGSALELPPQLDAVHRCAAEAGGAAGAAGGGGVPGAAGGGGGPAGAPPAAPLRPVAGGPLQRHCGRRRPRRQRGQRRQHGRGGRRRRPRRGADGQRPRGAAAVAAAAAAADHPDGAAAGHAQQPGGGRAVVPGDAPPAQQLGRGGAGGSRGAGRRLPVRHPRRRAAAQPRRLLLPGRHVPPGVARLRLRRARRRAAAGPGGGAGGAGLRAAGAGCAGAGGGGAVARGVRAAQAGGAGAVAGGDALVSGRGHGHGARPLGAAPPAPRQPLQARPPRPPNRLRAGRAAAPGPAQRPRARRRGRRVPGRAAAARLLLRLRGGPRRQAGPADRRRGGGPALHALSAVRRAAGRLHRGARAAAGLPAVPGWRVRQPGRAVRAGRRHRQRGGGAPVPARPGHHVRTGAGAAAGGRGRGRGWAACSGGAAGAGGGRCGGAARGADRGGGRLLLPGGREPGV